MNIKKTMILIGSVFVLIVSIFLLTSISIYSYGEKAKPSKADCIIVLGCSVYGETPSPFLKARLNQGIKAYKQGYAHKIIVSGGQGTGEKISEAEAMKTYLINNGIIESDVIMEKNSYTTYENILNSKNIMMKNNFKSTIIVSNKYHLMRAALICKKIKIKSSFSGVYLSKYKYLEFTGLMRETVAYLRCLILGVK